LKTTGTRARFIDIEIDQQNVSSVRFIGGCRGNLEEIPRQAQGHPTGQIIALSRGITCRIGTRCTAQLAIALEERILRAVI